MATYQNDDYASKGVGNAGLTLGVIGTALASGILNNGVGGLFGGNQNPATNPLYLLSQKDTEIARLQAEKYSDNKVAELSKEFSILSQRVAAIEVAEPLREQILQQSINSVSATVARLVQPMIPNANVAPGWGPAFVSPFPPVPPVFASGSTGGTATPATSSTTTAQAA